MEYFIVERPDYRGGWRRCLALSCEYFTAGDAIRVYSELDGERRLSLWQGGGVLQVMFKTGGE